jgi:hypothetical protein
MEGAQFAGGTALNPGERVLKWTLSLHARGQPMRVLALLLICTCLAGCGAVALPFRATADVARVVPVAGNVVATPLDAAGDAIDPPGH